MIRDDVDVELRDDWTLYRDVVYATVSGFRPLLLDVVVPRRALAAPVVLSLQGGGFSSGTHKVTRNVVAGWVVEELTGRGIAVASVQYRLSGEALFPAQVHDVKAAVRWLKHHGPGLGIDSFRVGGWGDSAGGYLTAMLAVSAGNPGPGWRGRRVLRG